MKNQGTVGTQILLGLFCWSSLLSGRRQTQAVMMNPAAGLTKYNETTWKYKREHRDQHQRGQTRALKVEGRMKMEVIRSPGE